MPLRIRLSLIFAGFAVVLVTLIGLAASITASGALRKAAERQLSQAAQQMSERLDLHMFERLSDITTAVGMQRFFTQEGRDSQRIFLERLQKEIPNYAWVGLTDPDGRVLVATGGLLEGEDVSSRPWFAAGRKGPAALDVHEAKLLQRYLAPNATEMLRFVDVAAPLYDEQGGFVGVLAAHLSWRWVDEVRRDVLSTIADLKDSDLLVLSRDGKVLLGPQAERGAIFDPKNAEFVSVVSSTEGMAQFKGLGWSVVARQPGETAFAPIVSLIWAISLIGLGLVALAALTGWKVASAIARPLSRLANQATAVQQRADVASLEKGDHFVEVAALSKAIASAFRNLHQKEEELLVVNALLEERVLFRTRQLEEARQRAEAATQAKSDFLATVSHEIRSPLNSITGFADLLLDEPRLPPDVSRRIRLIQSAGEALTTVIGDILDWSKIEAGKVELTEDTFALSCLLKTSLDLIEVQAASKGLRLELTIADDVPAFVRGDMARLRQIVLNLLNNAAKFTEEGSIALSVSRLSGSELQIDVTDTGIGMSGDQLGKLFKRFSQADSSIERRFGGTGLGLAISHALAELMGGTLAVSSKLGQGSTFTLAVALPEAERPADFAESAPPHTAQSAHAQVQKIGRRLAPAAARILLVEDLAVNREVASAMLEKEGYRVTQAENGYRALELAKRERFDLILMDIQMPGLDGLVTTLELRRRQRPGSSTPIVALTANIMTDRIAAFKEVGMDDFIAKPIQRSVLLAKVAEWLGKAAELQPSIVAADLDVSTFDQATFEDVVDLLGVERVIKSLQEFADLVSLLSEKVNEPTEQAKVAHQMISLAGIFGFGNLAESCRTLEIACKMGVGREEALAVVLSTALVCLRVASELAEQMRTGEGPKRDRQQA